MSALDALFAHIQPISSNVEMTGIRAATIHWSLRLRWLSYDDKRSPEPWISLGVGFCRIDHREHGFPQRLGMGELWIARACAERANH